MPGCIAEPVLLQARSELEVLAKDTAPIRLTRFTSKDESIYQDSPAIRLGGITLSLIECQDVLQNLKAIENAAKLIKTVVAKPEDLHREWLNNAIQAIHLAARTIIARLLLAVQFLTCVHGRGIPASRSALYP